MSETAQPAPVRATAPRVLAAVGGARWSVPAALAGLWLALTALHVWRLVRFRRGFPVDVDESGYLWFSFMLHDRLRAEGLEGLLRGFQSQGHIGPLLPSVTAVLELGAGARQIVPSMAVQTLFLGVLLLASYGLGARLHSRGAGLFTALLVGTTPAILDFVRTYQLPIPSTAMYTLAAFCLVASHRFQRPRGRSRPESLSGSRCSRGRWSSPSFPRSSPRRFGCWSSTARIDVRSGTSRSPVPPSG